MSHNLSFYSALPYQIATDRLKNAKVRGVHINLRETDNTSAEFVFDLLQELPVGRLTTAHLKGTLEVTQGRNIRIEYETGALSHQTVFIVPVIGITITVMLMILLPPELVPIASMPGIASILFSLFWGTFNDEVRKGDQHRLKELLERMLEKNTIMATWQG